MVNNWYDTMPMDDVSYEFSDPIGAALVSSNEWPTTFKVTNLNDGKSHNVCPSLAHFM